MSHTINRRNWLRKSALLTGGAALLPGLWQATKASPAIYKNKRCRFHLFARCLAADESTFDI